MAQLILVRHGETNWDKENRVQGALDIPLNADGTKEAQRISGELSKFKIHAVYSSPASCSFSTACEIAAVHKLKVKKTGEFNEVNQGVWQGLLVKDIKRRYKKQYNSWKTSPTSGRPPKGESIRDAYDRAISAMHKIVDKHKDENVCIVSGDTTLSIIRCYLKNADLKEIRKFTPGKIWWEAFEL
ncbi:MAG: histidine phosphatase family protein [Candidatus Omnitrophota bacterium]